MRRWLVLLLLPLILVGCVQEGFSFFPSDGKDFHDATWGDMYHEVMDAQSELPLSYGDEEETYSTLIYRQPDIEGYQGERQYIFKDQKLISGCYSVRFSSESGEKSVKLYDEAKLKYTQIYGAPVEDHEQWNDETHRADIGQALGSGDLFYYTIFDGKGSDIVISLSGYGDGIELYISFEQKGLDDDAVG